MQTESFIPEIATDKEPQESDLLFIFHERKMLVRDTDGAPSAPSRGELPALSQILEKGLYIGTLDNTPCYTAIVDENVAPDGYSFISLRYLYFRGVANLRPAISTAALVRDWAINTRYCGRCGAKTSTLENEWCSTCPDCGYTAYPRMSPAVIVAVLKDGKILLAHNRRFDRPIYSLLAGFVEPGESLESTVHREILEEAGLEVKNLRYHSSQCWPFPDSLMIGYVVEYSSGELKLNEELDDAGWFDKDTMPQIPEKGPIARSIIDWYLETGGDGALPQEKAP